VFSNFALLGFFLFCIFSSKILLFSQNTGTLEHEGLTL
jgi:hypothetical protein